MYSFTDNDSRLKIAAAARHHMKRRGMSINGAAAEIGISDTALRHYANDEFMLSVRKIRATARRLVGWLQQMDDHEAGVRSADSETNPFPPIQLPPITIKADDVFKEPPVPLKVPQIRGDDQIEEFSHPPLGATPEKKPMAYSSSDPHELPTTDQYLAAYLRYKGAEIKEIKPYHADDMGTRSEFLMWYPGNIHDRAIEYTKAVDVPCSPARLFGALRYVQRERRAAERAAGLDFPHQRS